MRFVLLVLAVGAMGACAQLPLPVTSGVPEACSNRFTELACKEGKSCRWVNEHQRMDGTRATAYCSRI